MPQGCTGITVSAQITRCRGYPRPRSGKLYEGVKSIDMIGNMYAIIFPSSPLAQHPLDMYHFNPKPSLRQVKVKPP